MLIEIRYTVHISFPPIRAVNLGCTVQRNKRGILQEKHAERNCYYEKKYLSKISSNITNL